MPVIPANTKLLLHMDGTDASTTFTDSSGTSKSVTAGGNAQIDTAQYKFATGSGLFDGTGDWLTVSDSADFAFGTGDFTIAFWVRFNSVAADAGLYAQRLDTNNRVLLYWDKINQQLSFYTFNGGVIITDMLRSWNPSANTWYHVEVIRTSNTCRMFIDGTQIGTDYSLTGTMPDVGAVVSIGGRSSEGDLSLNGWLDEFIVVKGTALHTSNFTPESLPYGTVLNNPSRFYFM